MLNMTKLDKSGSILILPYRIWWKRSNSLVIDAFCQELQCNVRIVIGLSTATTAKTSTSYQQTRQRQCLCVYSAEMSKTTWLLRATLIKLSTISGSRILILFERVLRKSISLSWSLETSTFHNWEMRWCTSSKVMRNLFRATTASSTLVTRSILGALTCHGWSNKKSRIYPKANYIALWSMSLTSLRIVNPQSLSSSMVIAVLTSSKSRKLWLISSFKSLSQDPS